MLFKIALIVASVIATTAEAQDEFHYRDQSGGPLVLLPYGAVSFADRAHFQPRDWRAGEHRADPTSAVGAPDDSMVSLGCGRAHLVLEFTDNVLVNIPGPDLYVFEDGPVREATDVAISANGEDWIDVGRADGALAEVDIGERTGVYRFVRLTNRSASCENDTPGADIDAIAAIGSGPLQQLFQSSILFDFNEDTLRTDALPTLDGLSAELLRLNPARAFVVGHADGIGSDRDNLDLSERRAATVRAYLAARQPGADIRVSAYGEARPIDDNNTEAGRARNRRVEVLIVPR